MELAEWPLWSMFLLEAAGRVEAGGGGTEPNEEQNRDRGCWICERKVRDSCCGAVAQLQYWSRDRFPAGCSDLLHFYCEGCKNSNIWSRHEMSSNFYESL
jgi:hypothetical protein